MAAKSKFKAPKELGACADQLWTLRKAKAVLAKQVAVIEDKERVLKDYVINTLPKSKSTGVSGRLANVRVETKKVPTVKDWKTLQAYVKKTGAFELLGRRLSREGFEDLSDGGKRKIPGVEMFGAVTVSVTSLK